MNAQFSLIWLLVFALLIGFLVAFVQAGALVIAFDKLGLSAESAFLLLIVSLGGSMINLPLFRIKAERGSLDQVPVRLQGLLRQVMREFKGKTVIALNVGGGLIPICFSAYLLHHNPLPLWDVLLSVGMVSAICYAFSRPIPGLGIGMPLFIAPVAAAIVALVVNNELSAPLAYVCGVLGVLIGADLLRINDIRRMGVPIASIGGAGTFDGIFLTGFVAVLLA
jgi:uncharacterized membrane protein